MRRIIMASSVVVALALTSGRWLVRWSAVTTAIRTMLVWR